MIEHLAHSAIDKAWWDAQLLRCENKMWYAQSWVLNSASPGWEALVDRVSGALMPLTWRTKYGVPYLYQPYGLQQLGVFAPIVNDALQAQFLAAIPKRFKYWDIYLNAAICSVELPELRTEERVQQELTLDTSIEDIRKNYSENHRRNLRKASACEVLQTEAILPKEFVALFAKTTGDRFGNTDPQDMQTMHDLITDGIVRNECALLGIRTSQGLHAAVCLIRWQGRLIWFKAATDEEGQKLKAMFYLIDRVISQNVGVERILDFAGSNIPSVARFNAGFGAGSSVYLHLKRNALPVPLKWFKN